MNLEISIEYDPWNNVDVNKIVQNCANCVFLELNLKRDNIEMCFLFTNDDEIQTLNRTYRGIDQPTNVLSFPADSIDFDEDDSDDATDDKPICLIGSAAFAYETIEKESHEQQKSFSDHLNHLVIHSILHLLGYDHVDKFEMEEMERLEIFLLKKLNIENPYE